MIGQFPDSGDTNVPTNAVVQLLFDHDLYASSVNQGGIVLETGGGPVQFQSQTCGARVMLTGVALLPNTTYKVRTTNRLLDANGIASDQPVQFEFTTTGGPAPTTTESVATGPPSARSRRSMRSSSSGQPPRRFHRSRLCFSEHYFRNRAEPGV